MTQLSAAAYFPVATPDCPTFVDTSEWHPLIDGVAYFTELDAALRGLGPGDSVQICGLQLWSGLDLAGRSPGSPGYEPLGPRLVELAAAGVQVRILVAGVLMSRWFRVPSLREFRHNLDTVTALRDAQPAGSDRSATAAPLAGCSLLDWSGPFLGSNHQKLVAVSRGGTVTAFVAGIDLVDNRFDTAPHDRLRLKRRRWGWHDAAVRLRGPAAGRVHDILVQRWRDATTLPPRRATLTGPELVNPRQNAAPLARAPDQPVHEAPGTSVRVLRSIPTRQVTSVLPWRRRRWATSPPTGTQEVFATLTAAISAAQRYVYLEDQYLREYLGGPRTFELYPALRDAACRGVRVILLGSGERDPEDPGIYLRQINSTLNRDLRRKLVSALPAAKREQVAVWRLEHCTVHSKLVLVDDTFACIGSANMFSRSMSGVDSEVSAAVTTTTALVRDLRVRVWGEHLRGPLDDERRTALTDIDTALGMWRTGWASADVGPERWRAWAGESALRPVWPSPAVRRRAR